VTKTLSWFTWVVLNNNQGNAIMSILNQLPETGFIRLQVIVGNSKASPPILPIIPISKSTWWAGVKSGRFPKPVKLSARTTAWRVTEIRELIESFDNECEGES